MKHQYVLTATSSPPLFMKIVLFLDLMRDKMIFFFFFFGVRDPIIFVFHVCMTDYIIVAHIKGSLDPNDQIVSSGCIF